MFCVYVITAKVKYTYCKLICAKSKVAPIKPTTVLCPDLCAAYVSAKLSEKIEQSLWLADCIFWTDSYTVLR